MRTADLQRAVLAHIGRACRDHNVPPLDRGMRNIVAQMVANLAKAAHPPDEIEKIAVELALVFDRFHGHQAMLGLQRIMETRDEDRQEAEHLTRKQAEHDEPMDSRVAAILNGARQPRRPLPDTHRFVPGVGEECAYAPNGIACGGPPGVHVPKLLQRMDEVFKELAEERRLRGLIACPECGARARAGHECRGCGTFLTTGPRDDERHAIVATHKLQRAQERGAALTQIGATPNRG